MGTRARSRSSSSSSSSSCSTQLQFQLHIQATTFLFLPANEAYFQPHRTLGTEGGHWYIQTQSQRKLPKMLLEDHARARLCLSLLACRRTSFGVEGSSSLFAYVHVHGIRSSRTCCIVVYNVYCCLAVIFMIITLQIQCLQYVGKIVLTLKLHCKSCSCCSQNPYSITAISFSQRQLQNRNWARTTTLSFFK